MSRAYREWKIFLSACVDNNTSGLYQPLHNSKLVGLFTLIFVKAPLLPRIRGLSHAELKRGLGGLHGNKVRFLSPIPFRFSDTSNRVL